MLSSDAEHVGLRAAPAAAAGPRRAVAGVALVLGAEDLQPHRRALVDQAGEAAHLVAGAGPGNDSSMRAEHPRGLAGPRQPGVVGDLGHRLGELRPQRLLQRLEVLAAGLLGAGVVDDPVRRPQVLGHLGPVPRLARHDDAGGGAQPALQRVEQRLLAGRHRGQELARLVGRGHEVDPQVLGQAADQPGDQLLAQAGHVPGEVVGGDPVEGGDRYVDGEPVVGGAGLEVVADREGQPVVGGPPLLRVVDSRTASAVSWVSISGSKVSRSGRSRRSCFHHWSKCAPPTTSAPTRAS